MAEPLNKRPIVQDVMVRIVGMMQNQMVKPGDRLPSERQLADAFKVSRGTIRSATQILAFNKFLTIKPGSGIYFNDIPAHAEAIVAQMDTPAAKDQNGDFMMQNECRMIMEPAIARLAALYAAPEKLEEIRGILERMREYVDSGSFGGYAVEDMYFHRCLAEATGNPYLARAADQYCMDFSYLIAFGNTPNLEEESFEQHEQIFEAILARDPDRAEKLMIGHIRYALGKNQGYVYAKGTMPRRGVLAD